MAILLVLLQLLSVALGIVQLVCFILVLIKMFQNGQTGLGVACIVLIFCGIGGLIAFVYGWMNNAAWNIKTIMLAWTGCLVGSVLLSILTFGLAAAAAAAG